MDVQDAVRPPADEVRRQDGQEAGQDDHVHIAGLQLPGEGGLKVRLTDALLEDADAGDAVVLRPLQGVGAGVVGHHQDDLPVGDVPGLLGQQQMLQVGAAAGDQDGNAAQHMATLSSPVTISPRT